MPTTTDNLDYFLNDSIPNRVDLLDNRTRYWINDDDHTNFINNQPNPYNIDSITYRFNEKGFRSDSFTEPADKKIIFIGCSMTEGIGLPKEETWSYILLDLIKKETGLIIPYWNLGMAGCGLDSITRISYNYFNVLTPNLVFGFFPVYRREFKSENGWNVATPSRNLKIYENNPILIEEQTIKYETEKNLVMIDLILQKYNSTLIWDHWDQSGIFPVTIEKKLKNFNNRVNAYKKLLFLAKNPPFARDAKHPGKDFNKQFALQIFEEKRDVILTALS